MAKADIFDHVIDFLEYQKRRGVTTVDLAPETRDALFADGPQTESTTGQTAATPSPAAVSETEHKKTVTTPKKAASARGRKPLIVTEADPRDWDELIEAVLNCTRCDLAKSRTHAVFGEGAVKAPVMFIGEGPGYNEDQTGRPFVGRAGKLLTKMIKAMQFRREDVFITNIVKCRPPGNRNPEDNEAATCLPYLNRQIDIIRPQIIVLLGAVPLKHLLGLSGITKIHGSMHEYRGVPVLPTYHPSFLLRSPQRKSEAWEDLQKVMRHVGKNPEQTLQAMRQSQAG